MDERKVIEVMGIAGYCRKAIIRDGGGIKVSLPSHILEVSGMSGVKNLRLTPLAHTPGLLITPISTADDAKDFLDLPAEDDARPAGTGSITWRRKMSVNGNGRNIGLGADMLRFAGLAGLYECDIVLCPDGLMIRRPASKDAQASTEARISGPETSDESKPSPGNEEGLF